MFAWQKKTFFTRFLEEYQYSLRPKKNVIVENLGQIIKEVK
jgi:hypothetical protein